MIVFGGITWTQTDLLTTDTWRDRDRRCFKMAKDLPSRFHDKAMKEMVGATREIRLGVMFRYDFMVRR